MSEARQHQMPFVGTMRPFAEQQVLVILAYFVTSVICNVISVNSTTERQGLPGLRRRQFTACDREDPCRQALDNLRHVRDIQFRNFIGRLMIVAVQ